MGKTDGDDFGRHAPPIQTLRIDPLVGGSSPPDCCGGLLRCLLQSRLSVLRRVRHHLPGRQSSTGGAQFRSSTQSACVSAVPKGGPNLSLEKMVLASRSRGEVPNPGGVFITAPPEGGQVPVPPRGERNPGALRRDVPTSRSRRSQSLIALA